MTVISALVALHALHRVSKLGYCAECGFRFPCRTAKLLAPVIKR